MCRVLKVSRSVDYKYLNRKPSVSEEKRDVIAFHAKVFHKRSRGIYGYRKVYEDFKAELPELSCSRETVRKIMHENRLFACLRRRYKYPKPNKANVFEFPKNKLNRNYKTTVKNLKWTGDITYIRTTEGWVYLAVVMDLYSRKIVGG